MIISRLVGLAAVGALLAVAQVGNATAGPPDGLVALRAATAPYHNLGTATQHGYGLFTDAQGIACIAQPGVGAMGVHYVDSGLVGDPAVVGTQPEALVYSPDPDGKLRLAAVEYVVLKDAWDATHQDPPELYGQMFMVTDAPNRYGLPPFYSLHVWVWTHNPAGTFAMWNPQVHCPGQ
jgi:hypothetical protein